MNKKMKGVIAGCVAVVVLVAALIVLLNLPGGEEATASSATTSSSISLNEQASTDVKTVKITNETGTYTVEATGEDGTYTVTGLDGVATDSSAFSALTADASGLSAKELIEENPTDLAQYGLKSPKAEVAITYADGSQFNLAVGDEAPLSAGTYGLVDGKVYLFLSSKVDSFLNSNLSFVDKTITPAAGTDDDAPVLSTLTLEGTLRPEAVEVVPSNSTTQGMSAYNISKPRQRDGDNDATSALVTGIYGQTASNVVAINPTEAQLKEYGLAEPYSKVTAAFEKETITLIASEPKDGKSYVMNTSKQIVFEVKAENASWITVTYPELISNMVLMPMINGVDKVTISTPEKDYVFDLTLEKDENDKEDVKVSYNGKELDIDNFKQFYQNIIYARHREFIDVTEPTGTPILSFQYEYTDSAREPDVLAFYKAENAKVYVSYNGVCESMEYQTYVDRILSDVEKVIQDKEVISII